MIRGGGGYLEYTSLNVMYPQFVIEANLYLLWLNNCPRPKTLVISSFTVPKNGASR